MSFFFSFYGGGGGGWREKGFFCFICLFLYIFTFQVHALELNVFFELLVLKLFTLTWAGCSQAN